MMASRRSTAVGGSVTLDVFSAAGGVLASLPRVLTRKTLLAIALVALPPWFATAQVSMPSQVDDEREPPLAEEPPAPRKGRTTAPARPAQRLPGVQRAPGEPDPAAEPPPPDPSAANAPDTLPAPTPPRPAEPAPMPTARPSSRSAAASRTSSSAGPSGAPPSASRTRPGPPRPRPRCSRCAGSWASRTWSPSPSAR